MAEYYHLNVYKSSYKLLVGIHKNFQNLNREHKYTIGEKVKERCFDLLINIYKIQRTKDRVFILEQALDDVEYLRLSLRLLRDLSVLSTKRYANLIVLVEDVSAQFDRWRIYEKKSHQG